MPNREGYRVKEFSRGAKKLIITFENMVVDDKYKLNLKRSLLLLSSFRIESVNHRKILRLICV